MIADLLRADPWRMNMLNALARIELPDMWIAAGFVRNMIWDHLHQRSPTPLNDIDVIYFDPADSDGSNGAKAETALHFLVPGNRWQVRNQALMHKRNSHPLYLSSFDAMSYWPEIETAVAVRLSNHGEIEINAPFGIESLLAGHLTQNPKASPGAFAERVNTKGWLRHWPKLRLVSQP